MMGPPRPAPKKSRLGLWVALGALALFGSCGTCAAIGAMLPAPEKSASSKGPKDDSLGASIDDGELRRDVPKGAAKAIKKARRAIKTKDYRALKKLLVKEYGTFQIDDELEAKTTKAAIKGWKANPKMLRRIDQALSEPCEVDPPEDGHIMVTCGTPRSGRVFVLLSNMLDKHERRDLYLISSVSRVH